MVEITALIPVHPGRASWMLTRAYDSVKRQTYQPLDVLWVVDQQGLGAAATRNRGLRCVRTDWVAFLDSDDEWLPNHLEVLATTVAERESRRTPIDVVYTGCRVVGPDGEPVPLAEDWGRFGRSFDADLLRQRSYLPVTSLVRTSLAQRALFGPAEGKTEHYDDWGFYLRLLDLGARFLHFPEVTWVWHHHGQNTSGLPGRGDAA